MSIDTDIVKLLEKGRKCSVPLIIEHKNGKKNVVTAAYR
jgi:hypothetical protein